MSQNFSLSLRSCNFKEEFFYYESAWQDRQIVRKRNHDRTLNSSEYDQVNPYAAGRSIDPVQYASDLYDFDYL